MLCVLHIAASGFYKNIMTRIVLCNFLINNFRPVAIFSSKMRSSRRILYPEQTKILLSCL